MAAGSNAYLVVRLESGYGDVYPLLTGQRCTLGRASTNRVVIKDELCSREHAEVAFVDGRWRLRDLGSLNGTRLNGTLLDSEWELSPGDEIQIGRTRLLFVEKLEQLPQLPAEGAPTPADGVAIKKRLGQTRFLTPVPPAGPEERTAVGPPPPRHSLSRDLALLYRLALDMGAAATFDELVRLVLDGLLNAIPAEVGAVLTLREGETEVVAYRHRDPHVQPAYLRVSEYVTHEVLASREAILAEDVARDRYLRNRDSLASLGATSLICAPILHEDRVLGLIHLYCTNPERALGTEDLEFTMAVAKQLGVAMHQLQRQTALSRENQLLRDQLRLETQLIGDSPVMKEIERQISLVAPTNATVLIRGESGVGKELVARAIHALSPRREGPFVCLNCAAITETLLESELFGHEKGAFTGATEKKIGKFEAAHGGTIFLDEIGEMPPTTQAKLLRVLEGHPFERVGGSTPIRADVRVVAATNQPLEQALQAGTFRRDLFYRLQVVEIQVPPLRQRKSDIPLLARHFLARFTRETGRKIRDFTPAALQKLLDYSWPGNVRELRNAIERAVVLSKGPLLDAADIWLSPLPTEESPPAAASAYQPLSLEEVEKQHILRTLQYTEWNKSQAAAILQIERSTLDRKIKAYDLKR
jgi:transcriptional regulator with GAF, ATPase, and Fis domain